MYKIEGLSHDQRVLLEEGKLLPLMEEFYTIQGEGYHSGKAAYFIRIGGCDVGCHWCDVKESWDAAMHPLTNTTTIIENALHFPSKSVVITGGEPLQYNLTYLTQGLKEKNALTFIETSGAFPLTGLWDWVCLSPKKNMPPLEENCIRADELKIIVYNKHDLVWAEEYAAKVKDSCKLFLQPEWSKRNEVMPLITDYIMNHPRWMASLQSHKYMNIP